MYLKYWKKTLSVQKKAKNTSKNKGALYVSSRSWDNFLAHFYKEFSDPSIFDDDDDLDASSDDEPDKDEDEIISGISTPTNTA
ncbi:hypothetical protein RhiirA4_478080 [Rhizophagus irregularis]|uniref:Uncharacterized protein n=1 Tax=Rhizophagus irregularis TaxID=588596 RepID=A0A2I1HE90_9GLOM|nr:hypothetical protein RhiirA4_478080 [Rhizophagus irregularis]